MSSRFQSVGDNYENTFHVFATGLLNKTTTHSFLYVSPMIRLKAKRNIINLGKLIL